jgi:hypothetical protein
VHAMQATTSPVFGVGGRAQDGEMGTPVPRAACAVFCTAPILTEIGWYRCRNSVPPQGIQAAVFHTTRRNRLL